MKICTGCNEELKDEEFYKRPNSEKLRAQCIKCTNKKNREDHSLNKEAHNNRMKQHYIDNKDDYKKRNAKYRETKNGKKVLRKARIKFLSTDKGKESVKKSYKKWSDKNKEKKHAHWKVNTAIRNGKLKRLPCEKCGNIKSEGHHEDYSKPLDVIWLCNKHHKELHRKSAL